MIEEKNLPLVSIVVPCYNHEKYVKETIESIINQTYKNIELIVIDDGSKDNSVSVIQELADKYGFTFIHRPNKGLSATLNEGIKLSKGKYFCACASDDIYILDKIEKQVEFMEVNEKIIAIFGAIEIIDNNSNSIKIINKGKNSYKFNDVFFHDSFLPAPTAMIRLKNVLDVGGYNPKFIIEDWYLWLRLLDKGGQFINSGEVVVKYRRHDDNLSKKTEIMWKGIEQILEEYKKYPNYNKAFSRALLTQANDVQVINKLNSLIWAGKAIKKDFTLIFNKSFFKFFIKLFLPKKLFKR